MTSGPDTAPPARGGRTGGAAGGAPTGGGAATALLVLAEAGLLAVLGLVPGAAATPWPALGLWTAAFALYAAAAVRHDRRPVSRRAMWACALALRLPLLFLLPHFSDDIWRYLWDGWVGLHGLNPFAHAPASPALDPIATPWRGLINHPAIRTIYPPGAQLAFTALAALGPSVLVFKAAWTAADLGVGWVLDRIASRRGGPPAPAPVLWLWSPLVVVEVAWSGHVEPLGILPMLAALLVLRGARPGGEAGGDDGGPDPGEGWRAGAGAAGARAGTGGRALAAGLLLGTGAAVKLAPAAVLPSLGRRRGWWAAAAGLAAAVFLYLPYAGAGAALFSGLGAYADRWRFDPGLFRVLAALLGDPRRARIAAAAVVGGVVGWGVLRAWPVERAAFWTLGAALLLSPTLHPWYLLWVLPLAFLRRSRAWVLWSGLVFLGYAGLDAYRATGSWPLPGWLALLIHVPFLALLTADAALAHGRGQREQIAPGEQEPEGRAAGGAAEG